MRIRRSAGGMPDKIDLQMTPMIDVVFQLLIFFIFSFKIVTQEGDFNVKMPIAGGAAMNTDVLPPFKIRLIAGENGALGGIQLDGQPVESFRTLHEEIIDRIGVDAAASLKESAEVELDCDYDLDYRHVIEAITACSGYIAPDGNIVKLIEKIRFAPPKR
jgi:biopolymer transport protein ExbD